MLGWCADGDALAQSVQWCRWVAQPGGTAFDALSWRRSQPPRPMPCHGVGRNQPACRACRWPWPDPDGGQPAAACPSGPAPAHGWQWRQQQQHREEEGEGLVERARPWNTVVRPYLERQ